MDALLGLALVFGLVALDLLAMRSGADSRQLMNADGRLLR